jgi:uncharacterized protein
MELSGGTFSMDVHNVLADDDVVAVLVTINAQRNGVSASFPEVHVWQIKNGKMIEFREYQGDEQRSYRRILVTSGIRRQRFEFAI